MGAVILFIGQCHRRLKGIPASRPIALMILLMPDRPRLIIIGNTQKPQVLDALDEAKQWFAQRADVVAAPNFSTFNHVQAGELPDADLIIVFGGDGTMISQARNVIDLDLPVVGVNYGSLGFLTEFSFDDLCCHWDLIVSGKCPSSSRVMVDVMVFDDDAADCRVDQLDMEHCKFQSPGFNDAVITAGPPFRMIQLELCIDPSKTQQSATTFFGDGVIVATPGGSTAYNLSAHGPIIAPGLNALCITPICPQSISFRPVVVSADSGIALRVERANEGTTMFIDGQRSVPLMTGEQVYIRKYSKHLTLLQNPDMSYWDMLSRKMHWAARPKNF